MSAFERLLVPAAFRDAVADGAWYAAMLEAERALARVEARVGLVPAEAAAAIEAACEPGWYDAAELAERGRAVANPGGPLVEALRARVGGGAARYVHYGATSQDLVDTAAMLVASRTIALLDGELEPLTAAVAALAERHRATPMAARTLLQQAVSTTFGAKCAGWLLGLLDARAALGGLSFPAELGGAAGTLAPLGDRGIDVLGAYAAELGLAEPVAPWHARRQPVAAIGFALSTVAAACAKVGLDVVLLAQTEVADVAEADGGGSSAMPHKRNPAQATLARACARLVHANVAALAAGEHEHERAAGAWQAEWSALASALAFTGGAAAAARASVERLEVDADRMRANMTGALSSERDAYAERGLDATGDLVLGSAVTFVDRALAAYRESGGGPRPART